MYERTYRQDVQVGIFFSSGRKKIVLTDNFSKKRLFKCISKLSEVHFFALLPNIQRYVQFVFSFTYERKDVH